MGSGRGSEEAILTTVIEFIQGKLAEQVLWFYVIRSLIFVMNVDIESKHKIKKTSLLELDATIFSQTVTVEYTEEFLTLHPW